MDPCEVRLPGELQCGVYSRGAEDSGFCASVAEVRGIGISIGNSLVDTFVAFVSLQASYYRVDSVGGIRGIQYCTPADPQTSKLEWIARLGTTRSHSLPVH